MNSVLRLKWGQGNEEVVKGLRHPIIPPVTIPLSPFPCPYSPVPIPLSLFPCPYSLVPIPLSLFPCPPLACTGWADAHRSPGS